MKMYEGTLHFYAATGETPHFYCWTGDPKADQHDWEHHVPVNEGDGVEICNPENTVRIILHFFPGDYNDLKGTLKSKGHKLFLKAAKENWNISVVKYTRDNRRLN